MLGASNRSRCGSEPILVKGAGGEARGWFGGGLGGVGVRSWSYEDIEWSRRCCHLGSRRVGAQ